MNKRKLIIAGALLASFFTVFVSCDKKVGKLPVVVPAPAPVASFCDSIKYNKHIKPIIMANCANSGCHEPNGSGNGDFTVFGNLSAKVSNGSFKARVFDAQPGPMPASGKLAQSKLDSIKCWLDKGAPERLKKVFAEDQFFLRMLITIGTPLKS